MRFVNLVFYVALMIFSMRAFALEWVELPSEEVEITNPNATGNEENTEHIQSNPCVGQPDGFTYTLKKRGQTYVCRKQKSVLVPPGSENGLPETLPIPATDNPEMRKAFEELRRRYAKAFQGLKEDEQRYKIDLARCLDSCVLLYGGYDYHPTCAKTCRDSYDSNLKSLKKRFEILQQEMQKDIQKILQNASISQPNIPTINPNVSVRPIDDTLGGGNNGNSTTNITNNTSTETTTTIINNETNNDGGNGNGVNVTVKTQDYSGFLGSISGSLNDIKNRLTGLVGNNNNENSKSNEKDKEQACKQGTLGCTELGNLNDINLGDDGFEIKKQEIDVSKNFVFRRVVGSSAVCPAPLQIQTSIFSFVISYDLVCQYTNLIRGFVLLAFSVVALRIALREV